MYSANNWYNIPVQKFFQNVYDDIFCLTIDTRKTIDDDKFFKDIQEFIMQASYDEILTFIEGISHYWRKELQELGYKSYNCNPSRYDIYNLFNNLFQTEYVGYRFVNNIISPITDEIELNSINESLQNENDNILIKHLDF